MNKIAQALRRMVHLRSHDIDVEEIDPNSWQVPYVNLMTVLMILFLVLYGFNNMQKTNYEKVLMDIKTSVVSKEEQAIKIHELESIGRLEQYIWNSANEKYVKLNMTAQKTVITLDEPILFDAGDDSIKNTSGLALKEIADFIRVARGRVYIEGHTDDVPVRGGRFRSNWELSAARAYSLMRNFVDSQKLDPARFVVVSCSQYRPVAPNDSPENRLKNRRIEISIISPKKS